MQISTREISDAAVVALAALSRGDGKKEGVVLAINNMRSQVAKALETADSTNEIFRLQGAAQVLNEIERMIDEAQTEVEVRRNERR